MILHGCFDESGKWQDSKFLAFAGYVSWIDVWNVFASEWQAQLVKHGLKSLHTNAEKRPEVLLDFARIIKSHRLFGVCTAIDTSAYRSLPSSDRRLIRYAPKALAFYLTIKSVVDRPDMDEHHLGLICDDDQEYSMECYKILNRVRNSDSRIKEKVFSICFADDKKYSPLQAADLLAYLTRQELMRRMQSPQEPCSSAYQFLTEFDPQYDKAVHRGKLLTGDSLQDFVSRLRRRLSDTDQADQFFKG
jgi:hypothetical protein